MNQEEQFLEMLENHKGILYKIANAYCRDAEARKDLVQEMAYHLWKSFGNYNVSYKHSTWIYRIAPVSYTHLSSNLDSIGQLYRVINASPQCN